MFKILFLIYFSTFSRKFMKKILIINNKKTTIFIQNIIFRETPR